VEVLVKEVLDRKARKLMQNPGQMTNNQVSPDFLIELENKYAALARKEVEARMRAGLPVVPEWLNALESKYQALAWQEIANRTGSR
jgi:hypothetical protein